MTVTPSAPTTKTLIGFGSSGWPYYRGMEQPASN
jgi:hypothetical protein